MKDGRIAEEGTHQTLLENENGEYANLRQSLETSTDDILTNCGNQTSEVKLIATTLIIHLY